MQAESLIWLIGYIKELSEFAQNEIGLCFVSSHIFPFSMMSCFLYHQEYLFVSGLHNGRGRKLAFSTEASARGLMQRKSTQPWAGGADTFRKGPKLCGLRPRQAFTVFLDGLQRRNWKCWELGMHAAKDKGFDTQGPESRVRLEVLLIWSCFFVPFLGQGEVVSFSLIYLKVMSIKRNPIAFPAHFEIPLPVSEKMVKNIPHPV